MTFLGLPYLQDQARKEVREDESIFILVQLCSAKSVCFTCRGTSL